jgi:hypothetical protein
MNDIYSSGRFIPRSVTAATGESKGSDSEVGGTPLPQRRHKKSKWQDGRDLKGCAFPVFMALSFTSFL